MRSISVKQLTEFLKSNVFEFQPTQKKLCFPIILRIYFKMTIGVEFENINVDNSLLINGHHRYICSLLSKKVLRTNTWGSPSQIPTFKWAEIEIDLNDWETIEMIDRHNSKDAAKSGMDIKNFENLM